MKYTLENLEIPNPCPIKWDEMKGNNKIRNCEHCKKKIYNLSLMPNRKALKILNQSDEKVCVTYLMDEQKQIIKQTYFGIFRRNLTKYISATLAIIFSFTLIQASQTKHGKLKKKKLVKMKKYKKIKSTKPPIRVVGTPKFS